MQLEEVSTWVAANFKLGDVRRSRALAEMAWGLMQAPKMSFAAIGRSMESGSSPASEITRVFKFCHNSLVDPSAVQAGLINALVGQAGIALGDRTVVTIAMDWHAHDNGRMNSLRVSLMTGTRAIPLFWAEIETTKLKGCMSQMEQDAIRELIRFRPPGLTWLILLDSGFRSPDLIQLLDEAGYYVVRSTLGTLFHSAEGCWTRVGDLPVAVGQIVEFGWGHLSRQSPLTVRLVGARIHDVKPPKPGGRRSTTHHDNKSTDPGLCIVATNLPIELVPALVVIRLYSRRFEIEHNFRDLKNASLGMDMEHVHLRDPATYERLMCIVAVAEALLWLAGSEAEKRELQRRFTPSQPRDGRRILSLRQVGHLCLRLVKAPILQMIEEHLRSAIASVITVVGRTWKDGHDHKRLKSAIIHRADLEDLARSCDTKRRAPTRPCTTEPRWELIRDDDCASVVVATRKAA